MNELVAQNSGGLTNEAGEAADWIELRNDGTTAADLAGWYLTDKADSPTKWRFPDGTTITSNGYLVVFADSSDVSLTNGELHANFSLSKDGEYLGLVCSDGVTVADAFAPEYPQQYEDISYGRAPHERELVGAGTPAHYRVPNAAGNAPWIYASGALGFSDESTAFTVRYYEMNSSIPNVDTAEAMVTNSAYWKTDRTYPIGGQYNVIDFYGSSSSGYFTNNLPFPTQTSGVDKDWFVTVTEGNIYVPEAGMWTFSVGSDDGFRLRISGHGYTFSSEFTTGRSFGTTLATFSFPVAGVYSVNLIYYENTGGSSEEFSVAQGYQSAFSTSVFHLTGDPAGGVLHAGAISSYVETDIGATMCAANSRLDAEWSFILDETPATNDTVTLDVRCADGFSASLNGTPLAALNVPAPLLWNSAATAGRSPEDIVEWISYPVPVSALIAGTNILSIIALNDSVTNSEFLIQPRLVWRTAHGFPCYFKTPTPGAPNGQSYTAPTPKVTASVPRGYKTEPFTVSLYCEDAPSAVIFYTLDGSVPTTNSSLYTTPLTVTNTTVLRAAAVDPGSLKLNVKTVTWLFLEDILRQGSNPPAGWPASQQVTSQVLEYGMRQATVDADPIRLRNGMTNAIPSISLVTDLTNLFSATSGIYVNANNDGIAWERPVSVELIDPVRGSNCEFRIDAGLRIRGAYSRYPTYPKHALRLFFRSEYGESKLKFKLFDDEGADEFDKVDLRCSENFSWASETSDQETFVRETFSRDSQRDMGEPYTRSRYYHLYINGQYWGLYQTQERADSDYADTYLGGRSGDWDCIKTSHPGYVTTASDGTFDAFYALHDIAVNQGFSGAYSNNYWRVRGLNPDGTVNTNYPAYVDQDNLIDYMLVAYYTGDPDSPVSLGNAFPNNMYGLFDRVHPTGFKWFRHDAEHSLGANGGYPVTCDTTSWGSGFTDQSLFNPATLHLRLCENPDYRMRFADLVRKHLYGDGALTPTNAQLRFSSRMKELDLAIIAESARWGRGKTRDANWLPACNSVLNTYLSQRRDILVNIFRACGWYPWLSAPSYSTDNVTVPSGYTLRVSATNAFYYTTDGSDPRLPGGDVNPSAHLVTQVVTQASSEALIPRGAVWRYHDLGAEPAVTNGLTWKDTDYPDSAWSQGPAILGVAGSATANTVATTTRRYVNGVSGTQVVTTYFRHAFTASSVDSVTSFLIDILRDDGAVVYLNGTEILRENMPSGTPAYDTWSAAVTGSPDQNTYFTRTVAAAGLLHAGTNVLAVEVHQCNASSSDLYLDLALTALRGGDSDGTCHVDVTVTNALTVLARSYNGADWSALAETSLSVIRPPVDYSPLRVSELMYAPPSPEAGSPYVNDDFAWIELRNNGSEPLDLAGVSFVSGISHTFEPLTLAAGQRMVLAKNIEAFSTRHPTNGLTLAAWSNGNLARKGETLSLADPDSSNILTFTYSNAWHPETYNTGRSLVAVDLTADEPLWSTGSNWRPSATTNGSPGKAERPVFTSLVLSGDGTSGSAPLLTLATGGLDGTPSVWYSDDLVTWTLCPADVWTRNDDTLTVDLASPALRVSSKRFFQVRISD